MATINTLALLKTNWAAGGTHTIVPNTDGGSGGVYTLDADLIATLSLTIILTGDTEVIIDANDGFDFRLRNTSAATDYVISGLSETLPIKFIQGDSHVFYNTVPSTGAVTMEFNYCEFNESLTNNGFSIAEPLLAPVTAVLNNCKAQDNSNDGFAIVSGATGNAAIMTLNNCTSSGHNSSSSTDGATAHEDGQILYINGGTFSNNTYGVHIIGGGTGIADKGAKCFVTGGTYTDNDVALASTNDNVLTLTVDSITISSITERQTNGYGILSSGYGITSINNCSITGNATAYAGISIGSREPVGASVTNCIIKDFTKSGGIGFEMQGALPDGTLINNTFDNNYHHVMTHTPLVQATNNLFTNATFRAWENGSGPGGTYTQSLSDYNNWYGNVANFEAGDSVANNDLEVDPEYDVNYKPQNPDVLIGGKPDINGNPTQMGAVLQNDSIFNYGTITNSIIIAE